ncbi:NACHT domain-containing protein [Nonomuraea sp. CA-141351]|uniref:NACHT domain-containing protein n=1 Tax=Nonomuraea sp. CA-141351 TaxID=3239996 RepID=UPI003D926660
MNEIVLMLAGAVVKTAFKIWVGDSALAENVTADTTDYFRDRVTGALNQRKARRWVEDLEERVLRRLEDYIEVEFRGIADNERAAAIAGVAESITKADLTDKAIFERDLDALRLKRLIQRRDRNATRDLSEQGAEMYDQILREACAYIISLTTSLPEFSANSFIELLRRDTIIIEKIDEVLARLPAAEIKESVTADATVLDNVFATAYKRQIVARLDHLRLFGVDTTVRGYPLTLAYVSLETSRRMDHPAALISEGAKSIESLLKTSSRVFVRGQAGSGKTTLLQWLAVRAARDDFPAGLEEWRGLEPFFIPLRNYVDAQLPDASQFVLHVGRHVADDMPEGWVGRVLAAGRGLILIDGVDELPEDQHERVRQWLHQLTIDYPNCRYVVTSRPGAVPSDWLAHSDIKSTMLAPMSGEAIKGFVRQWYAAVRSEIIDAEEQSLLKGYESDLIHEILTKRQLGNLATTPLLCALICALYRDRHAELPHDKMGIYDAALAMLERRDPERNIRQLGTLGRPERRLILQDLAFWLLRNKLSDAAIDRVEQQIARTSSTLHKVTMTPQEIYRSLLVRSGLLQEPTVGTVGFIHRTFQEYLAAKSAVDGDSIEELLDHALDPQWSQTLVMAAGHATPQQRERIFKALLRPIRGDRTKTRSRGLMALACLETSPRLPSEVLELVKMAASRLLPPRTRADEQVLIAAGDIAIDLLSDIDVFDIEAAAGVLRVLLGTKFEGALPMAKRVVRQVPAVAATPFFVTFWTSFDPVEFAREVLQPNRDIIQALLTALPECADALTSLHGIPHIHCTAPGALPDLQPLAQMQGVESLEISATGVIDLMPFAGRRDLEITVFFPLGSSASYREADGISPRESLAYFHRFIVNQELLGSGSNLEIKLY